MKSIKTTSDIYFAAALLAVGAELEGIDRTDEKHMRFTFTMKSSLPNGAGDAVSQTNLDTWETSWANGKFPGNFCDYANAIKRMKSVVHSH